MTDWPFGALQRGVYGAILADPPWNFVAGDEKNPRQHYPCMHPAEIAMMPVGQLAARNCALFMWATAPMLPDAIGVMEAWGFHYKTAGSWEKESADEGLAFGPGYILRSAAEFYLVGTRGEPIVRNHSVRNCIRDRRREHSRKPERLHRDVEALYRGPYAELFGRAQRPGWDVWGNQTTKFRSEA